MQIYLAGGEGQMNSICKKLGQKNMNMYLYVFSGIMWKFGEANHEYVFG